MQMKSFFAKKVSGLNSDIDRHREQEQRIKKAIESTNDPIFKECYRVLLGKLLKSKASCVSKLGKK